MAALGASAVSLYPTDGTAEWYPDMGNRNILKRRLKLVLTGQGGSTNTIGANALGLTEILGCETLWDAENSVAYPAVVDPVNNVILLLDPAVIPSPVDVTSTASYITVTGTARTVAAV